MTEGNLAPIILFVYNRPDHVKRTVDALQKNDMSSDSILYIFSDGFKDYYDKKDVEAVRDYIKKIDGFKEIHIIEQDKNNGLMMSIMNGVTQIINTYGKIIVLEDDIVVAPSFLEYMNTALSFYAKEDRVMHVSAYMFPVNGGWDETFFYGPTSCWGWGTWKRAWDRFNPDAVDLYKKIKDDNAFYKFNINDSCKSFEDQLLNNANGSLKTWAIKWYASVFINNGLSLHPKYSLVQNVGFDGTGVNSVKSDKYDNILTNHRIDIKKIELTENMNVRKAMAIFYNRGKFFSWFKKRLYLFKKIFRKIILLLDAWRTKIKIVFLYKKYSKFTMVPKNIFKTNLELCVTVKHGAGSIVECGVWRGGMIAAISELLGTRRPCYLFDSFEGLPPAQEIDGKSAIRWQDNVNSPSYFNNCSAEMTYAETAMSLSGTKNVNIIKGWFKDTLENFEPEMPILILRLDGDWYESTKLCLEKLYKYVVEGGLIIIDDYYSWDGCAIAVHEFLYKNNLSCRIQNIGKVCYIIKIK